MMVVSVPSQDLSVVVLLRVVSGAGRLGWRLAGVFRRRLNLVNEVGGGGVLVSLLLCTPGREREKQTQAQYMTVRGTEAHTHTHEKRLSFK